MGGGYNWCGKTKTIAPGAKKSKVRHPKNTVALDSSQRRKVGRPKNAVALDSSQRTLMSMLRQVTDSTQVP